AQQVAQTGQVPKIESQPQSSQPVAPLPSFEPKPVTAEIPLVADPTTGEVR
ncbi:MAG: CrcB family protein, partial [Bifidobacterium adolescentis]